MPGSLTALAGWVSASGMALKKPKVAFIGSGGAAKGVAHLGVLRAVEELGVDPDIYVGASAGAIVGAFASQGVRAEEMVDWFRYPWARRDKPGALRHRHFWGAPTREQWMSPGYLTSGLFSIDKFERFMAKQLRSNRFAGLDKTLLVTATDVDGRGRMVFGPGYEDRVAVSEAVAASCCVPVLFRPYRIGGRYYMDGELVRTLSVDLAAAAGADVVIISNVYRPFVTPTGADSLSHSGGISVARQALNIMLSEKEKRGIDLIHKLYPNLVILNVTADLGAFPFTRRGNAKELLRRGYREALRVLSSAKERGVFDQTPQGKAIGTA